MRRRLRVRWTKRRAEDQLALLSARICGRTVAPRGDEEPSCRTPLWRTLGRLRSSKRGPVGFLSSSPMTDRRTALGSRPSASQITANENIYRRSRLVIQSSASARARESGDLKLWIASSSTASIRARMPDQGGAAFVCSSVETCKDANDTSAISFIEGLPLREVRAGVVEGLCPGGARTSQSGGRCAPRAGG